ncbi:TetR/AcrR family transcriptional regulator [Nakamurella lactea]|uniref:TetR/AcrR family transcriptional regulator n=1 Tax=Nakamurella lactea TaxID=459515 RepID=UPI0004209015|nr:TetR/AcrR family transcriptional regulator [Nakamurella lactea]
MRPTHEQIDTEIVDTAAGLFAVHGFERTSVQQIADAVGYSKTGLLHRFPSKQALLNAVDGLIAGAVSDIQSLGAALPEGPDRRRRLLALITESAVKYPGLVQYLLRDLNELQPGPESFASKMRDTGDRIIELVAGPAPSVELRVRAILALELICTGVVVARHPEHRDLGGRLEPLLVELAAGVIGPLAAEQNPKA